MIMIPDVPAEARGLQRARRLIEERLTYERAMLERRCKPGRFEGRAIISACAQILCALDAEILSLEVPS